MEPEFILLSPWLKPHSPDGLLRELQRELAPGHRLYGKSATALAVARDRDDVLFAIAEADTTKYAVVHLTWSHKEEPLPWPDTTLLDSWSEWIDYMKADHGDYTFGDRSSGGPSES